MGKLIIYLGDLVHDSVAKGPFPMPLNVGCVAAYTKKKFGEDVEMRIFKHPLDLIRALENVSPHILGLSNYAWNTNLNYKVVEHAKKCSAQTICVFGGPNFPIEREKEREYLQQRPVLDYYVKGQGETGFSKLVEKVLGQNSLQLKEDPVNGCAHLNAADDLLIGERIHVESLDEFPSPYLAGIMDEFFNENYIPIMETDRGCPYSCTFCAWEKSKVMQFDINRVKAELDYIAAHVKQTNLLFFANANFGLFERDENIAEYINGLCKSKGYPRHFYVEWAKNTSKRIIKMAEMFGDIAEVTMAFQSLDPVVLANIKRQNIKTSEAMAIQKHFAGKKLPIYSDLILGLPGETKAGHLAALRALFDAGVWHIVAWNCQTLKGSVLETTAQRELYGLKTKYRLYDIGFGKYADITAIEHEEVVRSTNTLSEEEILWFRPIHWLVHFMGHYKYLWQLQKYLHSQKIHPLDYLLRVLAEKGNAAPKVKEIIESFEQEARGEWFSTTKALVEYYSKPENYEKIAKGEFGKLNQKYAFIVLLTAREEFDAHAAAVAKILLAEKLKGEAYHNSAVIVDNIIRYAREIYVEFGDAMNFICEKKTVFDYDVCAWENDDYKDDLSEYARPDGITYRFYLPADQQDALQVSLRQYAHPNRIVVLRKMSEHVRRSDLFYRVETL